MRIELRRRRSGPAATVLAAVAASLVVVTAACGGSSDAGSGSLPDLTLPALDADVEPLDLGTFVGPAVINLWATWCAPCRRELPDFQQVSAQRTDVRFVGVDIGEDPAKAREYLDELGVTFEQYVDEAGDLNAAVETASLPVTLVIDADGQIATNHLGPMSAEELTAAIDEVTT